MYKHFWHVNTGLFSWNSVQYRGVKIRKTTRKITDFYAHISHNSMLEMLFDMSCTFLILRSCRCNPDVLSWTDADSVSEIIFGRRRRVSPVPDPKQFQVRRQRRRTSAYPPSSTSPVSATAAAAAARLCTASSRQLLSVVGGHWPCTVCGLGYVGGWSGWSACRRDARQRCGWRRVDSGRRQETKVENQLHHVADGRAGEGIPWRPLPGCVRSGVAGSKTRSRRVPDTGIHIYNLHLSYNHRPK